jgi:hypothetical protein
MASPVPVPLNHAPLKACDRPMILAANNRIILTLVLARRKVRTKGGEKPTQQRWILYTKMLRACCYDYTKTLRACCYDTNKRFAKRDCQLR